MKCARCGKKLTSEKYTNRFGALVGPECIKKNDFIGKDSMYKAGGVTFVDLERFPALNDLREETIKVFKATVSDSQIYVIMKKSTNFWIENFEVPAAQISSDIASIYYPNN